MFILLFIVLEVNGKDEEPLFKIKHTAINFEF